jgi:hypothetical protein
LLAGGEESFKEIKEKFDDFDRPELRNHFKFYEMTPDEQ